MARKTGRQTARERREKRRKERGKKPVEEKLRPGEKEFIEQEREAEKKLKVEETKAPTIHLEAPKGKKDERGIIEKTLDIVSAPLSQPGTFFTKGPLAGGEAVAKSRERIREGDTGEAGRVIGTTIASTIVAAAATIGTGYAVSAVSKAGIVGKGSGHVITKTGGVMRYATNLKSTALTKSFISKTFSFLKSPAGLISIIGSYPFAGFIKEEALQTLSFGVKSARDAGNLEDEQRAIDEVNEILDPSGWEKLIAAVPFANVVKQLKDFYKAAATKNELDQNSLNKRKAEVAAGETEFQRERRESDEAAQERKREFEEEEKARDLEEMRWKAEYYALIREGKFEEADELLAAQK